MVCVWAGGGVCGLPDGGRGGPQVLATRFLDLFKRVNEGQAVAPEDPLSAILNEMP